MTKIDPCYEQMSLAEPPEETTPIIGWYINDPVPYMLYARKKNTIAMINAIKIL